MHGPRGQKIKDQGHNGYENRHGRTVASDHGQYCITQYAAVLSGPLPAWVCTSIRLPCFQDIIITDVYNEQDHLRATSALCRHRNCLLSTNNQQS